MSIRHESLNHAISSILKSYLDKHQGFLPNNLHEIIIRKVEQPLIETILEQTEGNISKAAAILGLSRLTIRKKIANFKEKTK
jgi:Fis family transcriptional regulator